MTTVYKTIVQDIGKNAGNFLEYKMIVIFKDNAPQELKDYCYIHHFNKLDSTIKEGNTLLIDGEEYKVTAVGSLVNENLKELGHITFKFSGETEAEVPGTLYLEDKEIRNILIESVLEIIE
jgi:PTS system glucitol/sorbitol-specific IIA component